MRPAELHGQQQHRITEGTHHPRWFKAKEQTASLPRDLASLWTAEAVEQAISKGPPALLSSDREAQAVWCGRRPRWRLSGLQLGPVQFLGLEGHYEVALAGGIPDNS